MDSIINDANNTSYGFKMISTNACMADWNKFVGDMLWNNTYCPEIKRIIFNIGQKSYPERDENGKRIKDSNGKVKMTEAVKVLTTVVFFDDNTKVTVTNSEHDGVRFIQVPADKNDPDSTKVLVADDSSKEAGVVYAIVKRLIGHPDKTGSVIVGDGFGRKLKDMVDNAYDTNVADALKSIKQKRAKAAHDAKVAAAKPKNPSLAESVRKLDGILTKIIDKLA